MRYAIIESGGKQYKAVEGETLAVDRLQLDIGKSWKIDRILMFVDGERINVGAPILSGYHVRTKVVDHFKGPKVIFFRYRPKERVRVKAGHRQQYTRLLIENIKIPGESESTPREVIPAVETSTAGKGKSKRAPAKSTAKKASASKADLQGAKKEAASSKTTAAGSGSKRTGTATKSKTSQAPAGKTGASSTAPKSKAKVEEKSKTTKKSTPSRSTTSKSSPAKEKEAVKGSKTTKSGDK